MTTKQRILYEALTLFSEKGYSAVFVGDIADAVGIKAPSLYKHFKNKQAIFDACVVVFSERMEEIRNELQLPDTPKSNITYQAASVETMVTLTTHLFLFYLQDELAVKFRKMLMLERYHNSELNKLFEAYFIDGAVKYEEKVFSDLIAAKVIRKEASHILALRFYTPLFYLLQKYDMRPNMVEEAKQELALLVQEFCKTYGVKKRQKGAQKGEANETKGAV